MSLASASAPLTGVALGSISPSECEFLAKETLIKISPKFHHPKLKFISVCGVSLTHSLTHSLTRVSVVSVAMSSS
jgi:hypothetical protein